MTEAFNDERFQALLRAEGQRSNLGFPREKTEVSEPLRRSGDGFGGRFFDPSEAVKTTEQSTKLNTG